MKIKKITESALVDGNIQVNDTFQLIFEKDDTGIELDTAEFYGLHSLITDVLYPGLFSNKAAPIAYEAQEEECPDYIEPPEVSKSMGAGLEPEVVCEDGACRLVLPEEDPEPEPEPIKKKKPAKKTKRDYSKYISMRGEGVDPKEIMEAMSEDLGISNMTAENYYYTHVSKAAVPAVEKEKPVKERKVKKIDHSVWEAIDGLPSYASPQMFKDACAAADIGRGRYSVQDLKSIYLETHQQVRW